jgi:hypothetical protein
LTTRLDKAAASMSYKNLAGLFFFISFFHKSK